MVYLNSWRCKILHLHPHLIKSAPYNHFLSVLNVILQEIPRQARDDDKVLLGFDICREERHCVFTHYQPTTKGTMTKRSLSKKYNPQSC